MNTVKKYPLFGFLMKCLIFIIFFVNVYIGNGQTITTIAGNGSPGYSGDGGPATLASLTSPLAITVDNIGNIYIADTTNHAIRRIDSSGIITTIAGNGTSGDSGDGGPATLSVISDPSGIALDTAGNIYFSDSGSGHVRKIDTTTGIITTVAGIGGGACAPLGDGGPATLATLCDPHSIAFDKDGNLYISDFNHDRIRKVDALTGVITTAAGNGTRAFSGDGGPATLASIAGPSGQIVDSLGDLYILDQGNNRIRKVDANTGIITTIAGIGPDYPGVGSFSGDGGPAISAGWTDSREGIVLDCFGNIYFSSTYDQRIRKIDVSTGIINTVVGNGTNGFSGDAGPAILSSLSYPYGISFDNSWNLYISDFQNNRIRKVTSLVACSSPTPSATPSPIPTSAPSTSCKVHIWPNPFNPKFASNGTLKIGCIPEKSTVSFYTISGELIQTVNETNGFATWDGKNKYSNLVSAGIYFYVVQQNKTLIDRGKFLITLDPR